MALRTITRISGCDLEEEERRMKKKEEGRRKEEEEDGRRKTKEGRRRRMDLAACHRLDPVKPFQPPLSSLEPSSLRLFLPLCFSFFFMKGLMLSRTCLKKITKNKKKANRASHLSDWTSPISSQSFKTLLANIRIYYFFFSITVDAVKTLIQKNFIWDGK